jgi:hypothetical protein
MWHILAALGNCAITDLRLAERRGWILEAHNVVPTLAGAA